MNRRGFIAALGALPFVGELANGAPISDVSAGSVMAYYHDDAPIERWTHDPYCPAGQVHIAGGTLIMSPKLSKVLRPAMEASGLWLKKWTPTVPRYS